MLESNICILSFCIIRYLLCRKKIIAKPCAYRSKRDPIEVKNINVKSMLPAAVSILATPAVSRKPSLSGTDR